MKSLRHELFAAAALAAAFLSAPRTAHAQNADVNVQVGVAKRFLSDGTLSGNPGGLIGLQAHVAVLPMLRVGAYVDEELAPTGEPSTRTITSFGGRLKLTPPWPRDNFRMWAFVGLGYALVYSGGYSQQILGPNGSNDTAVTNAAGGGFVEVPIGIGGGYRIARPFELIFELSGRIGFDMTGSYYDSTGRPAVAQQENLGIGLGPAGDDTFGLFLTVGLGLDL